LPALFLGSRNRSPRLSFQIGPTNQRLHRDRFSRSKVTDTVCMRVSIKASVAKPRICSVLSASFFRKIFVGVSLGLAPSPVALGISSLRCKPSLELFYFCEELKTDQTVAYARSPVGSLHPRLPRQREHFAMALLSFVCIPCLRVLCFFEISTIFVRSCISILETGD